VVTLDQRRLADDADGVAIVGADFEAASGQPVRGFERLVAVGDARENDDITLPRRAVERFAQKLGGARLDDNLAIEVGASAEAQVLVAGARITIAARMLAASIGVDAEFEAQIGAVVARQDRARVVLVNLEARFGRFGGQVLHLRRQPRVGRVRDRTQRHASVLY
jgi:hypothetical protein